jgi:hypothetical protein
MMDRSLRNADLAVRLRRKVTIARPVATGTVVSDFIEAGQHLG